MQEKSELFFGREDELKKVFTFNSKTQHSKKTHKKTHIHVSNKDSSINQINII